MQPGCNQFNVMNASTMPGRDTTGSCIVNKEEDSQINSLQTRIQKCYLHNSLARLLFFTSCLVDRSEEKKYFLSLMSRPFI